MFSIDRTGNGINIPILQSLSENNHTDKQTRPEQVAVFSSEFGFIVTREQKEELSGLRSGLSFKALTSSFKQGVPRFLGKELEPELYILEPFKAGLTAQNYDELKAHLLYDNAYTRQLNTIKDTSWLNAYLVEGQRDVADVVVSQAKKNSEMIKNPELGSDQMADIRYDSTKLMNYFFSRDEALVDLDGILGRLILDLDDSNSLNNAAETLKNDDMIALDSNLDGLIDRNDDFFDKLKVITQDRDGKQTVIRLSYLVNHLDILDFVRPDEDFTPASPFQKSDLFRYADPVYTHAQYSSERMDRFMQTQNPGASGWITRDESNESFFATLGYERKNLDGKSYIQTSRYFSSKLDEATLKIAQEQRFEKLYREYKETRAAAVHENKALALELMRTDIGVDHTTVMEFSNPHLKTLEMEFERLTGLAFSRENLERVHKSVMEGRAVDTFRDMDTITGFKRNDDGTFQLKFDSGRSIEVEHVYYDTGSFLRDNQYRAWIILSSDLSFLVGGSKESGEDNLAVWEEDRIKTFKDTGIEEIEVKQFEEEDRLEVLLENGDGTKTKAEGVYAVEELENATRFSTPEERDAILKHPYADTGNPDNARTVAKG